MTITLIANAGILVEYQETGILIDGIHHQPAPPFSPVSPEDLASMQQGTGLFPHLDYLLFTHEHPDHCTPHLVSEHIYTRPIKGLLIPAPERGSANLGLLAQDARNLAIPCWSLGLAPGATREITLAPELKITAIGTRHMGPQYHHLRNDCLLLHCAGLRLLFTGDAEYQVASFLALAEQCPLDAVFVNPLFYHHPDGQNLITELFKPRTLCIYHLPFSNQDNGLLYTVQTAIKRYAQSDAPPIVLCQPHQRITLSTR